MSPARKTRTSTPGTEKATGSGFGQKLLSAEQRARIEARAAAGNPAARFRLLVDDKRRLAASVRAGEANGASRPTVRITRTGVVGLGGGRSRSVVAPAEFRGTTAQVAGLWPWCVGAGAPLIGTPLGRHLDTGEPVCFDPTNWFTSGFLTAPSLFVLGLNGFGKSSLVRRLVLGGIAQGIKPLILADVKPDYREAVEQCGGQIIDLGYGHGKINPLDAGVMGQALQRLIDATAAARAAGDMERVGTLGSEIESLRTELRARQTNLIAGLIELVRGQRIADFEDTIISTAQRILFRSASEGGRGFTVTNPPILDDLADVIAAGGPELQLDAAAKDAEQYEAAIIPLRRTLRALTQGNFGNVFNGPTTTPLDINAVGVCVDVSHIPKNDKKLKAAVMLASWSSGFGAIEALNLLAAVGLEKQRYFQVVMDELWQVLGLGEFMIERVDELTRLQRSIATALIMISHTIKDLQGLGTDAAGKALGFLERARAKIFGALPPEELARLDPIVPCTRTEVAMVTGWSSPQALTGEPIKRGVDRPLPPGVGKFLLKIGEDRAPGIPFSLELTGVELTAKIHETSRLYDTFGEHDDERYAS
ncbi:hypothetical protein [Nocardia terpenica]|uniref:ATP/GTP-binding protein n=1 Tax=Nocardia terpenica TaxID=455432 RepID=A0A291RYZ8_9NOCA|nr:hypothetical protein [Nocardia terpenica]ATL72547.1 hypothetical protein CRH09_39970 [Nocardia terpenica]